MIYAVISSYFSVFKRVLHFHLTLVRNHNIVRINQNIASCKASTAGFENELYSVQDILEIGAGIPFAQFSTSLLDFEKAETEIL